VNTEETINEKKEKNNPKVQNYIKSEIMIYH